MGLLFVGEKVSTDTLRMKNINYVGKSIVEFSVEVGPLTLHSSLRLFVRLTPSLRSTQSKNDFVKAMQTPNEHLTNRILKELFEQGCCVLLTLCNGFVVTVVLVHLS